MTYSLFFAQPGPCLEALKIKKPCSLVKGWDQLISGPLPAYSLLSMAWRKSTSPPTITIVMNECI